MQPAPHVDGLFNPCTATMRSCYNEWNTYGTTLQYLTSNNNGVLPKTLFTVLYSRVYGLAIGGACFGTIREIQTENWKIKKLCPFK